MKNVTEYVSAREIVVQEMNSLRGRLLSVIETANLPRKQEVALKTMIKHHSYQSQAVVAELIDLLDTDDQVFKYITQKLQTDNAYQIR